MSVFLQTHKHACMKLSRHFQKNSTSGTYVYTHTVHVSFMISLPTHPCVGPSKSSLLMKILEVSTECTCKLKGKYTSTVQMNLSLALFWSQRGEWFQYNYLILITHTHASCTHTHTCTHARKHTHTHTHTHVHNLSQTCWSYNFCQVKRTKVINLFTICHHTHIHPMNQVITWTILRNPTSNS